MRNNVPVHPSVSGVNLAGILGGRRGGSKRLGCRRWKGSGEELGPFLEKVNFSLENACFGEY